MKQTATEWLIDQMLKQVYFDGNKPLSITNLDHLQHQAKEMEEKKEYETKAYWFGRGILAGRENKIKELQPKK